MYITFLLQSLMIFVLTLMGVDVSAEAQGAELRVGAFEEMYYKSSNKKMKIENTPAINLQYLFPSLGDGAAIYKSPRPHLGCVLNFKGGTSQYYAGLTWHIPLDRFFIEVSFGGEAHNGPLKKPIAKKSRPLGSRLLFRESVAAGINLGEVTTISIILDHASNAHLANPNSGLTDIGLQIGYKF